MRLFVFAILALLHGADGQNKTTAPAAPAAPAAAADFSDPCESAPDGVAKILCHQIHHWDEKARQAKKKVVSMPGLPGLDKLMAADIAPIAASAEQCMTIDCLCPYFGGTSSGANQCALANGKRLAKARRQEIRALTDEQRARFFRALQGMRDSGSYKVLSRLHSEATRSGGAHSGPAFLVWHREYMKRFEIKLREVDPDLALPYWDSTLDSRLPTPADSILWTDAFFGTSDAQGLVKTGPFSTWSTNEGRANIQRAVGQQGGPLTDDAINHFLQQTQIENVFAFTAPRQGCPYKTDFSAIEFSHGNVHIFVGGDMFDPMTSSNDPSFYMHHSFVDHIFELYRQQRQSNGEREVAYPPDLQLCANPQHFGAANMNPFAPKRNVDGLSNQYTENMYEYAPRPTCAGNSCGSAYLFCDPARNLCVSKVKPGGNCAGFSPQADPCWNGVCQGGRCVQQGPTPPPVAPVAPIVAPTVPAAAVSETCFNENECCSAWVRRGECQKNPDYMDVWCKASCGTCKPRNYNLADECSDRHTNCAKWATSGECAKNTLWMRENCRQSCGRCRVSREDACGFGGKAQTAVVVTPAPTLASGEKCDSTGCYNENECCSVWGLMGQCSRNAAFMQCNCRVTCGLCYPEDYSYGTCTDYHHSCRDWAARGECTRNPWMLENCRQSCRNCKSAMQLRQQCAGGGGGGSGWGGVAAGWSAARNNQFNLNNWAQQQQQRFTQSQQFQQQSAWNQQNGGGGFEGSDEGDVPQGRGGGGWGGQQQPNQGGGWGGRQQPNQGGGWGGQQNFGGGGWGRGNGGGNSQLGQLIGGVSGLLRQFG